MPDVPLREATAAAAAWAGLPFCWAAGGPCFGLPGSARALPSPAAGGALLLTSAVASDGPTRSYTNIAISDSSCTT